MQNHASHAERAAEKSRTTWEFTILLAGSSGYRRVCCMGAKYLPTIKDQKAAQRFHQKQNRLPQFKKSASNRPTNKRKKR